VDKELLADIAKIVEEDKKLPDNVLFNEKEATPEKQEKAEKVEPEPEPEPDAEADTEEVKGNGEETDEKKPSKFSDDLTQRALDIGLSEEDVDTFPSSESLDKALQLIERRGLAAHEKREETPPAAEPVAKQEEKSSEKVAEDEIPDLDPEVFDEKLVEVWKGLKGVNKKQSEIIASLQGQLATISQQFQESHKNRTLDQVEEFFGQLGEEYVPFIGKGRGTELVVESTEMKSRIEILEVAESLMENYSRQRKSVPFKTALERATNAVLGDKLRNLESGKIASKLERRSKAFMPRGGGQNEKLVSDGRSPEDLAEIAVKRILDKANK